MFALGKIITVLSFHVVGERRRPVVGQSIISVFLAYNIGNKDNTGILSLCFTALCTIVQSAVLRLYVVRPSVRPSVTLVDHQDQDHIP